MLCFYSVVIGNGESSFDLFNDDGEVQVGIKSGT